ncbi:MAG: AAA family ATPase [Nocardioidaceae bacterium]
MQCPSCGHENAEGHKFCSECAASLAVAGRNLGEERKVVTSLFCDLVGFTATSESADPEDVNAMLATYFAMVKKEIEAFGGTVEKFIGDAVVGVFGVPAAHEDDPERAVRAGLTIVEAAEKLTSVGNAPLTMRVGINTGEALVRLGAIPGAGEGMLAGDAINTASRLQSVAPEMGVAVGLGTYQATARIFEYDELEPATLKGKAEPVRVFWAKAPRARFGTDVTRTHDTPLIGREIDLAMLKGVFDKTVAASAPQLVTIIGEPGLGKSRLVAELFAHIDERPGLVRWRQGRCLPYGEGITFWALTEILKAHTGILDSDPPATARDKLDAVLPEGSEREWLRQRLLPLLGIESTSPAEREELFTAWRRFFEHIAEQDPTILVFEDLHWADPAMLAFLEHLADRSEGVPMLIVGTARPELFDRQADYARGLRNSTPINLTPLTEPETTRLVCALLETTVIPAELQAPILERSGGNPLYAEEFVRLLKDRDLLIKKGSSWELTPDAEIPFPDSVQALIAARLDTLTPERKAMLADAAVIGKVFWAGAVAAMGDRPVGEIVDVMRELSRKELVRPSRRSSMEGEAEYAFWHVLARDVAYAQIPRASRASRHLAAATWIESKAPDHLEDLAEVLAHHYTSALELAAAAGQADLEGLEISALRFLNLAGERALGLDTAAALDAFERALALAPSGHVKRRESLVRFGEAAYQAGRSSDAAAALEEAIAGFRDDDVLLAARAMSGLSKVYQNQNDPRASDLIDRGLALLQPLPPGPELVEALADAAATAAFGGRPEQGIVLAERALKVAGDGGLPKPARALGHRGLARCNLGDSGGLQDFREALELAVQAGQGRTAGMLYNNIGVNIRNYEGPVSALDIFKEGLGFAAVRGLEETALAIRTSALPAMLFTGDLEGALTAASELAVHAERAGDELDLIEIRGVQALVLTYCGRVDQVGGLLDAIIDAASQSRRADLIAQSLGGAAIVRAALGERAAAVSLLTDIETTEDLADATELATYLPGLVRAAIDLGELELAESLAGHVSPRYPCAEHALVAVHAALNEAHGQREAAVEGYREAASRWNAFGMVVEEGFALLGQGRCLLDLSRPGDAKAPLLAARDIFTQCGMVPALKETDALLARATALTS